MKPSLIKYVFILSLILANYLQLFAQETQTWNIVVDKALATDEAIHVAIDDLKEIGKTFNIEFVKTTDLKTKFANSIIVGSPKRNGLTKSLLDKNTLPLKGLNCEQGYEIITKKIDEKNLMVVSGGSILGEAYSLFWILDRLKVNGKIPEINTIREPELKIRFSGGGTKALMRQALRNGATWVWGSHSVNQLIPWDAEPERTENKKNRAEINELIKYAHSLHLKYIVYEDEFSYHPTLLEEFGATLNPEDPKFWEAVQTKYRRLFKAMPEIDGVRHRTGESTRVGGNFKSFDMMHAGDSNWSLAKRYRTWIQKIHEVVVGEFDKIYYQRTWVTSSHEQHSMPEVYKEIFTEDVPVKNLYMSPYMSTTDRYFHQPYNPTFNQTPHNMIVLLSPLNYHGKNNCGILPTFPGTYYQGGLKTYLSVENSNCKGADFGSIQNEGWDTWTLTAYTVYRLTWEPNMDVKEIAYDFAAMYFGKESAEEIAELLLLTPKIYKYGMYIAPAAHGQFASLTHLRLTTFPVKGLPNLDSGRKHIEFLYDIYLRCRPWIEETYLYLDHGLELANKARDIANGAASKITDTMKKDQLINNAEMTYRLVAANNLYVKAMISYFQYRETKSLTDKNQLANYSKELSSAMEAFSKVPGFVYRLDGMKQLQVNIADALNNVEKANAILTNAPNDAGIDKLIDDQQDKYKEVLEKYKDEAVKLVYWQGRVDGRDLFKVKGKEIEIEHLRYDNIQETSEEFFTTLPDKEYTVVVKNIQSRSFGPFVLEQPSAENNYTVTLYLSDYPKHGYSWWKFELYYIPRSPKELGLEVPWGKQEAV
ncbi:MAG: hypothetical protein HQ522_06075 [Bacteroidetes bacterium]|nr:hypothetical protein [Bacteroidota bacterium]